MVVEVFSLLFSFCLIGYLIGRIGHYYYGHKYDFLHHWIYGIILVIVGILADFEKSSTSFLLVSFGFGLFISDFKDFKNLKFYGRDTHPEKKFLGFD